MNEWYKKTSEDVITQLNTNIDGLTEEEAKKRLNDNGKNELPKKKGDSLVKIFLRQLIDPIVILLIATVVFSFIINEIVDACAIIFIIVVDLLMGTFQEWKAEKNAEALANLIKVMVKVLRNKEELEIDSSDLVIGDIVLLESGNKISADMRIIDSHNLQVDESILTGESMNVTKNTDVILENVSLAERHNMLYAGTAIVTGRATSIVIATGIDTEIGKIAHTVTNTKETKSPLTIRMNKFSKQISLMIIFIAIIITCLLLYKGVDGNTIFLSVIALSVSAMPEGLPLALTMALTVASNKMGKKNVIVKKLNAVESLGSCTVIASDKTGTLTVNEQTAKKIVLPSATYEVTGTGYNNDGEIIVKDSDISLAKQICKLGYINNEAKFEEIDNEFVTYGDSIDIAFLVLGEKAKISDHDIEILGSIPYESENKYSAVFYRENNEVHCTVKGSIEKVIQFSDRMRNQNIVPLDEIFLNKQNEDLAKQGYRVIAIADSIINDFEQKDDYEENDIPNLIFEGMVAFIDPIRIEAKGAIEECHKAGIKVVMITGDHPLTAYTIAKELQLVENDNGVATGEEVANYLQKGEIQFDEFIKTKTVFTRVTPIEKLEIVNSYKRQGEFIAVTGDGVNDAPALRSANIGVAMGSGTDVAKETASMIIVDDNFTSIVSGIKEGRNAYSNIRKVSYMLLSCGFAEVLFFILSIICNLPMPLVAIQLLWLNIVTDGLQDFALSFEKAEKTIMSDKPRKAQESIFNKELFSEVLLSGLVIGLIVFGEWYYLLNFLHLQEEVARGYIMVLMVFMQNIHVLNCRSERESTFKISLKSNPFIIFSIISAIVLQIIVMEVPLFSKFLQTSTVPFPMILKLFLLSCVVLIVMEFYKKIKRYNHEKRTKH